MEQERQFHEKLGVIVEMAAKNMPAEDIACFLRLEIDLVRKHIANGQS